MTIGTFDDGARIAAADLEAVDAGQPDVEHDETHRLAPQLGDRLLPGPVPHDAPAVLLLEVLLDEASDRVVVLDEEEGASRCLDGHGPRIGVASARQLIPSPVYRPRGIFSTSTDCAGPTAGQVTTTCHRLAKRARRGGASEADDVGRAVERDRLDAGRRARAA